MRGGYWSGCLALLVALAGVVVAPAGAAGVPLPGIQGPIPGDAPGSKDHNYTFLATDLPLAAAGWVEQEFFMSGQANVYDATQHVAFGVGSSPDQAPTATVASTGHPYKTNLVVRRPLNNARFNGTVILEWTNVSSRHNNEVGWFMLHDHLIRNGYAYVVVSAQTVGIVEPVTGLKAWSPVRYGSLDVNDHDSVPRDTLSFDIFSQAAAAVRTNTGGLLGDLRVKRIIGFGVSQSSGLLGVYVNAIQPLAHELDALFLEVGGERIRGDLDIPVVKLNSEAEYINDKTDNEIQTLQPDADGHGRKGAAGFRTWGVAGTSHTDRISGAVRAGLYARDLDPGAPPDCKAPVSSLVSIEPVQEALLEDLNRWITTGKAPPHAPAMNIVSEAPPTEYTDVYGGHNLARDSDNNALGGIRLPGLVVPVATNTGSNYGARGCFLAGSHVSFDAAKLHALYPTHEDYVAKFTKAADAVYARGFILRSGRDALIAEAKSAAVP